MATLKEIAEAAGVSIRTVSRVLYNKPNIAAATQAKVQVAIDRLGYTPNLMARGLKTSRRNMLGIIVNQLHIPVLTRKLDELQRVSYQKGFHTLIGITEGIEEKEERFVREYSQFTDGLLFLNTPRPASLEFLKKHNTPYVLVDSYLADEPAVSIDRKAGVREAIKANRKNYPGMVFLTSDPNPEEPRHKAFLEETELISQAGSPPMRHPERSRRTAGRGVKSQVITDVDGFKGGYVMGDRVVKTDAPLLAVCYSDRIAMGLMKRLYELNISVPGQIGIVGFDNDTAGDYQYKSLSTVRQSVTALAEKSLDLMSALLADENPGSVRPVKTEYVKKDSTL